MSMLEAGVRSLRQISPHHQGPQPPKPPRFPTLETHYQATPWYTLSPIMGGNLFTTETGRLSANNNNSRSASAECPYMGINQPTLRVYD